jgi:hypothetical protein
MGQPLQGGGPLLAFEGPLEINAVNVLAMVGQVPQHTANMLLCKHSFDAVSSQCNCLVQPAVGPGSTEQAAGVVSTAAQHRNQAGVWEV